MIVPARPATTIILLRPDAGAVSVFLVQRHHRSGFFPRAWVFPGGRVDPGDRQDHGSILGGEAALRAMGLTREAGLDHLVAGVRETFEESGIWLGSGAIPPAERAPLAQGRLRLADLLDRYGVTIDLDVLRPWSWWITPEHEPRRYDTRFLVALAPGGAARHDERETVDSRWIRPEVAIALAEAGELPLAPPTWWTLVELARHRTVEEVLGAERSAHRAIQPILRSAGPQLEVLLPGHPDHPAPPIPGVPPRVFFGQGRWWVDQAAPR